MNLVNGDIPIQNITQFYDEVKRENIIRLLLRCKKMYQARVDVKKIIILLIAVQESNQEFNIIKDI